MADEAIRGLEVDPSYLKVEDQAQAQPRTYSALEVAKEGIYGSLKENTMSYLGDITQRLNRQYVNPQDQELTQEQFEALPGYNSNMVYYSGMDYEGFNLQAEAIGRQQETALMRERSKYFTVPYFAGGILGGFADPVMYTPLGLPIRGEKWFYNAARMAGANAAIELGTTPLAYYAHQTRGEDYTAGDMAKNVVIAAAVGGLISTGVSATGALYKRVADKLSVMGHEADVPLLNQIIDPKIDPVIKDLANKKALTLTETPGNHVKNIDPYLDPVVKFIGPDGIIHTDAAQITTKERVTINNRLINAADSNGGKYIELTGDNKSILKILKATQQYLGFRDQILINRTDVPGKNVVLNAVGVESWLKKEISKAEKEETAGTFMGIAVRQNELKNTYKKLLQDKLKKDSTDLDEARAIKDLISDIDKNDTRGRELALANLYQEARIKGMLTEYNANYSSGWSSDLDGALGYKTSGMPINNYEFGVNPDGSTKVYRVQNIDGKETKTLLKGKRAASALALVQDFNKEKKTKSAPVEEDTKKIVGGLDGGENQRNAAKTPEQVKKEMTEKESVDRIQQMLDELKTRDIFDINLAKIGITPEGKLRLTGEIEDGPNKILYEKQRNEFKKLFKDVEDTKDSATKTNEAYLNCAETNIGKK